MPARSRRFAVVVAALIVMNQGSLGRAATPADDRSARPGTSSGCPGFGWAEGLPTLLRADAPFPTQDTHIGAPDCFFHQWSWEAFVWATALDGKGVPRFMSLRTPEDLHPEKPPTGPRTLTLGTRAAHATGAFIEGTGAIVEADGNMLVAPNGYPVYASVHMNDSYFQTAQRNMIWNGGYQKNADTDYFDVGAAVFKATWLRLDAGEAPPAGAFVTEANVPKLTLFLTTDNTVYVTPSGQTETVKVALLGLHVVGQTINHPEFLWGTFEHKANSPRFADGTFDPSSTKSDPKSYTLYQGGTPFNQTNLPSTSVSAASTSTALNTPQTVVTTTLSLQPRYTFNPTTQKFSPTSNAVLGNRTGGENQPMGAQNIDALNLGAARELMKQSPAQAVFANYLLDGTVWMNNPYTLKSTDLDAAGSINLANVTAETFVQNASGSSNPNSINNCFSCHNPTTFQDVAPLANLQARRIALSHVLAAGSLYTVPNLLPVNPPAGSDGSPTVSPVASH